MQRNIFLSCLIVCFMGIISSAQDLAIWFGNSDGSTLVVRVDSDITVPVWLQTNPDVYIAAVHIPLSSNDNFITKRTGGELFAPLKNDYPPAGYDNGWDVTELRQPVPHNDKPGFTNQGLMGFMNLAGKPNVPLHCDDKCEVVEFYMHTAAADSLKGHTYDVFVEGYEYPSLGLHFSDTLGTETFKQEAVFSRVHFLSPGDVDGDFKITAADLTSLRDYLDSKKDIPWPEARADCNADGKVNDKDWKYLDKYLNADGDAPQ